MHHRCVAGANDGGREAAGWWYSAGAGSLELQGEASVETTTHQLCGL
jgi:hypothetical protein